MNRPGWLFINDTHYGSVWIMVNKVVFARAGEVSGKTTKYCIVFHCMGDEALCAHYDTEEERNRVLDGFLAKVPQV